MPRASLAFAVVFATGLILLLALGSLERRAEVFTLGVAPVGPLSVPPRTEVCQRSIDPPGKFDLVRLEVGSQGAAPPVFDVTPAVGRPSTRPRLFPSHHRRPDRRGREGGHGVRRRSDRVLPAKHWSPPHSRSMATMAQPTRRVRPSWRESRIDYDLDLRFLRADDASLLSLAGDMVRRAALFRGQWIEPWAVWLVVVLLLTAFPLLLYRALRAVED